MREESVTELIERLSSAAAGTAWEEFVSQYSPLIRHVVARHEYERDRADDCFEFVCEALSDDGFRRLRSFRPDGPARFRTWLMAVVANLCRDWRRRQRGRSRPFRSVSRLPELDQQVFRHVFVSGMSRKECVESLAPRFPTLTEAAVAETSARLFALLTPQQRWQLSAGPRGLARTASDPGHEGDDGAWQPVAPGPGPDEQAAELQERQQLKDALARLAPEQRLLLRLRYEQGLTLAEVARLTREPDAFRANRRIHAALDALAQLMGVDKSDAERKTP